MKNLITESRKWLSEKDVHWESVLYNFRGSIQDGSFFIDGIDAGATACEVEELMEKLYTINNAYHEGKIKEALEVAETLLYEDFYCEIPINTPLFRARWNDTGFLYEKEGMFHIPFDKRFLVGNQRFSVTGIPCLYLGGSPYVCWEELGRPDYQKCNYSGFKNREVVNVYDFCLPASIKTLNDVKRATLILACSIPANSSHLFKDEYIFPQCILQALIDKHYNKGEWFAKDYIYGIRYYSTHYLKGEMDIFTMDENDEKSLQRMVNYVFPSISNNTCGLSKYLERAFEYTCPTSLMHMTIKNAAFCIDCTEDEYISSSFGAIEDYLRQRLGVDRIRQESSLVFCNG